MLSLKDFNKSLQDMVCKTGSIQDRSVHIRKQSSSQVRKSRASTVHQLFDFCSDFYFSNPLPFLSLPFVYIFLQTPAKMGLLIEGGFGFPLFFSIVSCQHRFNTGKSLERFRTLVSLLWFERLQSVSHLLVDNLSNRLGAFFSASHLNICVFFKRLFNLIVNVETF